MEENLEDFLEEDMTKQVDDVLGTNENEDAIADDLNNENYYGENAGDILEDEEDTDGENTDDEEEDEEENYISNNPKPIGRLGEKFAKKYLEELFKINDVELSVEKPNKDNEKHDLEIYGNGEDYLIEVKLSTRKSEPGFGEIHFRNRFDYIFLIWHPNNKFYFSILSKEEIKNNKYATEMHNGRGEDNLQIQRTDILDEDISKNLSRVFNLEKDLTDERKLEIYEEAENETEIEFEKLYEGVDKKTLYYKLGLLTSTERGQIAQHSLYNFLKQYDANAENYDEGDFDILYKNRIIEVKFARLDTAGKFQFAQIKHKNFDFLFLIGLDVEKNDENDEIRKKDVFYFDLMTKEDAEKKIGEDAYSQNGSRIQPRKNSSSIKFVNHLTIEDIDNYIESH